MSGIERIIAEVNRPEYDPLKTAVKGLGASLVAVGAAKLGAVAVSFGIPPVAAIGAAGAVIGVIRNLLKHRAPRWFGWLP